MGHASIIQSDLAGNRRAPDHKPVAFCRKPADSERYDRKKNSDRSACPDLLYGIPALFKDAADHTVLARAVMIRFMHKEGKRSQHNHKYHDGHDTGGNPSAVRSESHRLLSLMKWKQNHLPSGKYLVCYITCLFLCQEYENNFQFQPVQLQNIF